MVLAISEQTKINLSYPINYTCLRCCKVRLNDYIIGSVIGQYIQHIGQVGSKTALLLLFVLLFVYGFIIRLILAWLYSKLILKTF